MSISAPRAVAGQALTGIKAEIQRRDEDQAYTASTTLNNAVAALQAKAPAVTPGHTLPNPSAAYVGQFYQIQLSATDDVLYWCQKKADGTYAWKQVS